MMSNRAENIQNRCYVFALGIVKLARKFPRNNEGFVVSPQLIRAATSVPANLFEGSAGVSKKDFIQFLSISKKSAVEANFWLKLSSDLGLISPEEYRNFSNECEQIIKILSRIILNAKR